MRQCSICPRSFKRTCYTGRLTDSPGEEISNYGSKGTDTLTKAGKKVHGAVQGKSELCAASFMISLESSGQSGSSQRLIGKQ